MTVRKLVACTILFFRHPRPLGLLVRRGGGAGAYGGYKAKESGYSLQNPVTKDGAKKSEKKDSE